MILILLKFRSLCHYICEFYEKNYPNLTKNQFYGKTHGLKFFPFLKSFLIIRIAGHGAHT